MSNPMVAVEQLSYTYSDGTTALNKISFLVHAGESVALIGANGAGKSTLLQQFTGCLLPSSGRVIIEKQEVNRKNLKAVRRKVGMIFQNPDDQLFMPTVFEDVAFGLLNIGVGEGEMEVHVMEALKKVGAEHLRGRMPQRLSQGEKRAVAIAGVLAMKSAFLVMDEPTSGLDPLSRRRLMDLLMRLGHTQIIATHDLDFARKICPRTILLNQGKILADGPSENILNDKRLLELSGLA